MFIQTEQTPNPNCKKFIPGVDISPVMPLDFSRESDFHISPLAVKLFKFDYVTNVFLGSDFITITIDNHTNWEVAKPELLVSLMEFFITEQEVLHDNALKTIDFSFDYDEKDEQIVKEILDIIENKVRPAVANDGGDIVFKGYSDGIVYLELRGSCSGCPSSKITLKNGIETMLKNYIPEILSVEQI